MSSTPLKAAQIVIESFPFVPATYAWGLDAWTLRPFVHYFIPGILDPSELWQRAQRGAFKKPPYMRRFCDGALLRKIECGDLVIVDPCDVCVRCVGVFAEVVRRVHRVDLSSWGATPYENVPSGLGDE